MKSKPILIADDNLDVRLSLQRAFQNYGFQTVEAADGDMAIAMIETIELSGVVLDIMMPKRSGIIVLEHIRTELEFFKPIFVLTGNESKRVQSNAELFDVAGYFIKPFNVSEFVNFVSNQIFVDNCFAPSEQLASI